MKFLIILGLTLPLFACLERPSDNLKEFVSNELSNQLTNYNSPLTFKNIPLVTLSEGAARDPFSAPNIEDPISTIQRVSKGCLKITDNHNQEPLEKFPMDRLSMRGTLLIGKQRWGLVQVVDGQLYKIKVGQHLGLKHGKVLALHKTNIDVLELIMNKNGCWKEQIIALK